MVADYFLRQLRKRGVCWISLTIQKLFGQPSLCFEKGFNILEDITLAFVRPNSMLHTLNIHKRVNLETCHF